MTDGPYRSAGDDRLGAVQLTFSTPRRSRYAGSGRAVQRQGYLGFPSPSARPTTIAWTRSPPGESVEVCQRGLRLRGRTGTLELVWDQIVAWQPVDRGHGLVAIELRGSHGESVTFDRRLRGLDELYAVVRARVDAVPR